MSLKNLKKANQLIGKLNERVDLKGPMTKKRWEQMTSQSPIKGRKPPEDFKESSFLYISSYVGDIGTRPGATGVAYWRSPDLIISPLSSLNSYTTELNVGTVYNFECLVHNGGDLNVPSAKVEFFLVTPSLGFDTRYGKSIGVVSVEVNCYTSARVNIQYLVTPEDSGHRCLFARVFSFSPYDVPVHDTMLNPHIDRRIGQKNVNIAAEDSNIQMNLMHMPQAEMAVEFLPMKKETILKMGHPSAADFKIIENIPITKMRAEFKLSFIKKTGAKLAVVKGVTRFSFNERGEYNLDIQKRINTQIKEIFSMIESGKVSTRKYRKEIAEYRKMNLENKMTLLNLHIPDLGLKNGEMAGFEIVATNRMNGEIFSGITLLVIGKKKRRIIRKYGEEVIEKKGQRVIGKDKRTVIRKVKPKDL